MNPIVANIYGTAGFEKTASAEGLPTDLYELSLMVAVETVGDNNLEKTASARDEYYEQLLAFDRAGRALAHQEFHELEKQAFEGNPEAFEEFFADVVPEESSNETPDLKEAIIQELMNRMED